MSSDENIPEILGNFKKRLEGLSKISYARGETDLYALELDIKTFIERKHPNASKKLIEYNRSVGGAQMADEDKEQEYYVSQIRKMDMFIDGLITEFQEYGFEKENEKTEIIKKGISGQIGSNKLGFLKAFWEKTEKKKAP